MLVFKIAGLLKGRRSNKMDGGGEHDHE